MRTGPAIALAVAGVAAGCQGTEEQQAKHAQTTVKTFLSACAREESAAARELLTSLAQRSFVRGDTTLASCTEVLNPGFVPSEREAKKAFEEATVTDVRAAGGFATVELQLPLKRVAVPLEQIRDRWLIADPDDPGFGEGA